MEFVTNQVLRQVLILVGVASGAIASYPGSPQMVKTVCAAISAVLTAVLGVSANSLNNQLKGARLENVALQSKLASVQEVSK